MKRRTRPLLFVVAVAVVAILVGSPASGASDRWFHIKVHEGGSNPTDVTVNLPLSLIEAALEVIPDELSEEVHVELNDAGFSVEKLRELWEEVRNSPDATFVQVESENETVKVAKSGDYFVVKTVESTPRGAQVDIKFPAEVVDALFSGGDHKLDLAAAIRALAEHEGDVVTVRDNETNVRIWVDDRNEVVE